MHPTLDAVAQAASRNAPKIFFALGTASVCGSTIMAAKVSPEAYSRYYNIKDDAFEDCEHISEHKAYVRRRTVREIVPLYIPAALLLGGGILSFAFSNRMLSTRAAGAAAAYALAEKTIESLDAYRDEVIDRYGEEVDTDIRQKIADDVPEEIVERSRGYFSEAELANRFPHTAHDTLWYDRTANTWFWATKSDSLNAESTVNQQLLDVGIATINDFYAAFPQVMQLDGKVNDAVGWDSSSSRANKMDILFGSKPDDANYGLAVNTISYRAMVVNPRVLEER